MGESEEVEHEDGDDASGDIQKRVRGKIQFPYTDLARAEELCQGHYVFDKPSLINGPAATFNQGGR